mgnify:CR=1 FL=1
MKNFVDFASGKNGRTVRIVVGAVLVLWAVMGLAQTTQWVVGVLGVVLILSGVLKLCVLNLLVGRPITACPADE